LRHFLARFCAEENRTITAVSGEALAALTAFAWPGNVRQLENAVYRAVVISDNCTLALADFPLLAAGVDAGAVASIAPADVSIAPAARPQPQMISHEIPIAPTPTPAALALLTADGEVRPIEDIESEVIRFAISHYRGQMSEVARRLKIGRSTLYRKLETMDGKQAEPAEGEEL
jgi:DNA-binding NtrC family response regulator